MFFIKKRRVRAIIPYQNGLRLIHRIKKVNNEKTEYYAFPGGGVEENETLEEAVIREIKEELGIRINPINQLYVLEKGTDNQIFFLCDYIDGEIGTGNGPEFTVRYSDSNQYIPEIVTFDKIKEIDLLEEIKKELLNDIKNEVDLTKKSTKTIIL